MYMDCVKYFALFLCAVTLAPSSVTTDDPASAKCGQGPIWMVYMNAAAEMIDKAKHSSTSSDHDTGSKCEQDETSQVYMDAAIDMINKAKRSFPFRDVCNSTEPLAADCSDLFQLGHKRSGVYTLSLTHRLGQNMCYRVYCDMETDGGGWTVIQRRGDFQNPVDYFYKDWKSYKEGFGDVEKEFWLGNDKIFALTNQRPNSVRFDLMDMENARRFAHYGTFRIDNECKQYTLHIADYSGNAGDPMTVAKYKDSEFGTKDKNLINCANQFKSGWWFKTADCFKACLNGQNLRGTHTSYADGINWHPWKGYYESLAWTEIKIRPQTFCPSV